MSLEQTIGNLEIRYANVVTFVGSSNTMVDTTTGRIQTKGIQHNSNVITDVSGPHGRVAPTLKKYPEIAFGASKVDRNDTTNTYVQAGYTVMASSYAADQEPYRAFDYSGAGGGSVTWTTASITNLYGGGSGLYGTVRTSNLGLDTGGTATPQGGTRENGEWITLQIPNKITLSSITISRVDSDTTAGPKDFQLYGSNDGTTWVQILSETGADPSTTGTSYTPTSTPVAYTYFGLVVTRTISRTDYMTINDLVFYGTEENPPTGDHSVDTTFKSRFNNPQLTGVQVLVDGATGVGTNHISGGPDPSGNQATMTSPNKYWTLNGTLTSNLSVEANTFLEGDQPHAVSVWFNSSNLEANVSNTCVFSISDQEKLNSQNLDLQSNTWHNLTYAYQGEGGSKVTYLDGRKVAEDQAEDTFGEYPPFEMTGYSQGGYVVSSSGGQGVIGSAGYGASKAVWNMFMDGSTGDNVDEWVSAYELDAGGHGPPYNTGSGDTAYTYGTGRNNSIGSVRGEWVKIEYPKKIVVSSIDITSDHTWPSESPRRYTVLGSDDDLNWTVIRNVQSGDGNGTSLAASTAPSAGLVMNGLVNASRGYTYIGIVITQLQNYNHYARIPRMRIYGRVENDLVRLPDPTNVLKYPHVAMTGPAQRGYVASVSSLFSDGTNSDYQVWKAFDGSISNDVGGWLSDNNPVTYDGSGNPVNLTGNSLSGITGGVGSRLGAWLKLELPHKIKFSEARLYGRNAANTERIDAGYIYGSNDDTNWTQIGEISVSGISSGNLSTYTDIVPLVISSTDTTNSYKYFIVQPTSLTHGNGYAGIGQMEFYGTGVDSVPIQIGGGNIDKVANFRVYDKFIGEDQVNEIWNAQKEEFGRAKPQMVLQQGKLGIGTDAPQGSLSVADEPHNLEEFPPRAMSGYKTYFEGHGEFCVSASDEFDTAGSYSPWKAFSKSTGALSFFITDHSPATYNTDGTPTAAAGTFEGVSGSWLKLKLPYDILLKSINLARRSDAAEHFSTALLYGSVDDVSWDVLHNIQMPTAYTNVDFEINATKVYKYFVIQITRGAGVTYQNIGEWKLFGTREQGQSVLHDGQLTLTKNLTVPRIGPALDADDTPRRDRLVVEYNTSTNPTFEGAVRDTSGRGNDGVFVGTASYNANEKALVFDGNSDYITGTLNGVSGSDLNTSYTISLWVKKLSAANNLSVFVFIGTSGSSGGANAISFKHYGSTTSYALEHYGGLTTGVMGLPNALNTWTHLVAIFDGTTQKIYVDGVLVHAANASGTMNIPNNPTFSIGQRHSGGGTSEYLNGYISNPKIYDTVLTAQEVKTLYDMGRTGSVANPQPLHISGPVNVMGDIRYITNIRPLPKQTMWDHETNGHFTRGIYPITGTQGGSKVYNMLCEPDWCGGGWMCAAQLPRGKNIISTTVNLFTDEYGDPSNLTWSNDFVVPMDIFSNDSGYDLDVMLVLLGGRYAGKGGAGGARNGGIYRGVNLTQALNSGWPTNGSYPAYIGTSGLASSIDGFHFVSRSTSGNNFRPYKANGGWRLSFSSHGGYDMAYDDTDIYTMGWLLHTNGNNLDYAYSSVHSAGASQTQSGETSWAAVRFFVRPKRY
jgi:hypothetical protein